MNAEVQTENQLVVVTDEAVPNDPYLGKMTSTPVSPQNIVVHCLSTMRHKKQGSAFYSVLTQLQSILQTGKSIT